MLKLRKIFFMAALLILAGENFCYGYEQAEVARFSDVRLLFVNYDCYGNWQSRAYSHRTRDGGKCLIVCTHGTIDYEGNFYLCIGQNPMSDYIFALENELIYWHSTRKLNLNKYDHIHLNACYSGYMRQNFTLPRLKKQVYVVCDYNGMTYYQEWFSNSMLTEVAFGNLY